MGRLIADFYCPAAKLVIEVDGDIHDYQKEYDDVRTRQLEDHGYCVIRFRNDAVLNDLVTVLSQIEAAAFRRIPALTEKNLTPDLQRDRAASSPNSGSGKADFTPYTSLNSNAGDAPPPLVTRGGAGR